MAVFEITKSLIGKAGSALGISSGVSKEDAKRGNRMLNQMNSQVRMMNQIVNTNSDMLTELAKDDKNIAEAMSNLNNKELMVYREMHSR